MILGVTGAPGAGKSTLVDQLTATLRGDGLRVGVIAVDPSSPFSGGAILGDRIRMQQHHADPGVFIRSMATRGHLGGLARGTLEMALLLDAAGFDAILIETVGVGQDEVEVARLADVCAVVLVPGMGDDVQALKAGIMEIADVFVINKCDLPGAERLEQELRSMMALAPSGAPEIPIVKTAASERRGIGEAAAALRTVKERKSRDGAKLWSLRLREMLRERLLATIAPEQVAEAAARVARRDSDPYTVVEGWMQRFRLTP
jgi:LAO/AO transport system kinase